MELGSVTLRELVSFVFQLNTQTHTVSLLEKKSIYHHNLSAHFESRCPQRARGLGIMLRMQGVM